MVNPATVSIVAAPASIAAGASSTLTVTAANASSVTVSGSDGSSYQLTSTGGTQAVSPAKTTTYTASAAGISGNVSATATVTVAAATPPTVTMTASPTAIATGSSSTLTVSATNATQVTVTGTDGSSYTLSATGGTQAVSPAATTTYNATATGAGGTASATATVTVSAAPPPPAPTVTISASPTAIAPGASSILTVVATNATQVTVTGSDGSSYPLSTSGGMPPVSPAVTTTYTATATGAGGSATATAKVTVTPNPAPTVSIVANPTGIAPGGSSTLTVNASNATQVTISGSDGMTYPLTASGGTQSVSPTKTTIYTATATGPGGSASMMATVTVSSNPAATVTILANPAAIVPGNSSTLTVTATNATQVTVTGSDKTTYTLPAAGGTQVVTPAATTTYTATATGAGGSATNAATVTVTPVGSIQAIDHVIFLLQENHSFDNYFGMLNPYRVANHWDVGDDGVTYTVDGLDGPLARISNQDDEGTAYLPFKFTSTCIDDESSDWLSSYGDVERYNFLDTRPIRMNGFVHTAEGFAKYCAPLTTCSGNFTDLVGKRAMGYYDQDFLNYYYYMASQFAISDRWFSPMASKSVPNRLATFTGGTTQGLVHDPGSNDHLPQLNIPNIFQELDQAKVTWKIYYTVTQGYCLDEDDCLAAGNSVYPAIHFSNLTYSYQYIYENPTGAACVAPTVSSLVAVGDTSNSYCVDPTRIAPLDPTYANDLKNGTLPSFAFIEAGYGRNDEHPGSGQPILFGQTQVASLVGQLMSSSAWKDSVFFVSYDEGGGPYDHVPPIPGHSNDFSPSMGPIPDISQIAVNPDGYVPCVPPNGGPATLHCDLDPTDPGANPADAAAVNGFSAQLGFRVPNMVISPFTRRHYVSHIPMDHTAIIKFVENRFIGSSAHLTPHDAAQPNLLDFFDFTNVPWATPPTPPTPATTSACTPASFGP
jgi:phospholipase C